MWQPDPSLLGKLTWLVNTDHLSYRIQLYKFIHITTMLTPIHQMITRTHIMGIILPQDTLFEEIRELWVLQ